MDFYLSRGVPVKSFLALLLLLSITAHAAEPDPVLIEAAITHQSVI